DRPGVLARLQHDRMAAELERAQLEAGAGTQRGIEEHQGDRLALERIAGGVALVAGSLGQQRIELGAAEVLGVEEVDHGRWRREAGEGRRGKAETKKPSAGAGLFLDAGMRPELPSWGEFRSARARSHARRH